MDDEIAEFYDDFLDRRMVGYRLYGNKRLDLANRFVRAHIARESRVLDVGCGIGLTTEAAAKKARKGRVWAFDLGSRNVEYARSTVRAENIEWTTLDVLRSPERLAEFVSEPVDVIFLVDVLEHIPKSRQPALLDALLAVAARDDVTMLFTFPSQAYQQYLRTSNPEELQPVDEDITATHLDRLAQSKGLVLTYWRSVDVWMTDQYVHACLRTARTPARVSDDATVMRRWAAKIPRRVVRLVRQRRYALAGEDERPRH